MVLKTRIQKDYLFEKHIKANSKRFWYRWIQKNRKYIEWIRFSAIHIAGHHKSLVPGWKKCGKAFFFDTKYGQSQCWNKNTHKTGTHSLYCVLNAEAAMLLLLVLQTRCGFICDSNKFNPFLFYHWHIGRSKCNSNGNE